MNQQISILFIFLFIWSCAEQNERNDETQKEEQRDKIEILSIDSIQKKELVETGINDYLIANQPCKKLQEFVVELEKDKWISDSNRLEKVDIYRALDRTGIKYFNDRPFYPIDFKNSRLKLAFGTKLSGCYLNSIDLALFENVKDIWGYFYREKDATNVISDGVIEQWEFENEDQAEKALVQINQVGHAVYFNINPLFCRIKNKLIVFQTRAMAFSYDQKPVFKKFIQKYVPNQ